MSYTVLSEQEEQIGKAIVNAAYKIHKELAQDYWREFSRFAWLMK